MSNQIPLSGAQNVSGGYLLPPEQGEILVNGILVETGAIQIAGDARATTARKTNFPIWLGRPTAGPVAEGAAKGVTGASFGQATLNIQKFASIILFTDEQIEDLQNGDLNVLADAGVRQALSVSIDSHFVGLSAGAGITGGSVFDSTFVGSQNTSAVVADLSDALSSTNLGLQGAVSNALNILEGNGYGNPDDIGVLLGFGLQKYLRDQRDVNQRPLYDGGSYAGQTMDALYGLDRAHSTNLASTATNKVTFTATTTAASSTLTAVSPDPTSAGVSGIAVGCPISGTGIPAGAYVTGFTTNTITINVNASSSNAGETVTVSLPIAAVVHKPNLHVRVRQDVTVKASNEASIVNGGTTYNLFQENLTALLYETRLGCMIHDAANAVVPIFAK